MRTAAIQRTACNLAFLISLSGCFSLAANERSGPEHGKSVYDQQCMQCHGVNGSGSGPASLGLGMTPPGLRDLSRLNDGVFPRDDLVRLIAGHDGTWDPDAAMPDFGRHSLGRDVEDPDSDTATTLPPDLAALLAYLESIQE